VLKARCGASNEARALLVSPNSGTAKVEPTPTLEKKESRRLGPIQDSGTCHHPSLREEENERKIKTSLNTKKRTAREPHSLAEKKSIGTREIMLNTLDKMPSLHSPAGQADVVVNRGFLGKVQAGASRAHPNGSRGMTEGLHPGFSGVQRLVGPPKKQTWGAIWGSRADPWRIPTSVSFIRLSEF